MKAVDAFSEELINNEVEFNKKFIQDTVEEAGGLAPMLILIGFRDPKTGKEHESPGRVLLTPDGELGNWGGDPKSGRPNSDRIEGNKNAFAQMGKVASVACDAVAAFFASEAWTMRVPKDISPEEAQRYIEEWRGRLHLSPHRQEVVILNVEHYVVADLEGRKLRVGVERTMWMAEMKRDGESVTLGEWAGGEKAGTAKGRFSEFLAPIQAFGSA